MMELLKVRVVYVEHEGLSLYLSVGDNDYTSVSMDVTFSSGIISRTVTVMAENDTVIENDEIFTLSLSENDDAVVVTSQSAIVTITDQTSKYIHYHINRIEGMWQQRRSNLYKCLLSLSILSFTFHPSLLFRGDSWI